MRRVAMLLGGLAVGMPVQASRAPPAAACACVPASDAEHAARATTISTGVLVDRRAG